MSTPQAALDTILARITAARKTAIAPAPFTTLIAVSKTHGEDHIRPLLEAGHRVFGENRVQEARAKWPALKADYPDIRLHLIGPLQSNKAREAVELFDTIHTLDRPKLADALKSEMDRANKNLDLFIQVNTGEESQKAGVAPAAAERFIATAREAFGASLKGLMCIPPADEEPSPHFAMLKKLAREHGLPWLSMGMSGDFETAIKFGATHVRVGSALFGARDYG
ncbi:MAG: YggS family pyridoxal phosphate-dependent enzyme [Alphaproteobacteria bacterium]|nr:YggS family pyridoxal phosphate-dependent enzyme [Alphaproteobacteria bacterium]